ncbi:SWIM zinc finger family protein [Halalkalicoccus subterraneus]|uniref:SWIM zinc finger family protein n=1 Tax=Halalkalicoccus subterraneus TaxID=2675002 RepID=UPI001FE34F0F|nr:SWIM zinc finger family protein [Halalkalicoccus subterraneus]
MQTTSPSAKSDLVASATEKTVKRAQWESFSFELEAPGLVLVTNDSHDEDGHSYLVNVETDVPVACECKAFEYGNGPCKHMVAVAIREPVLKAAQVVPIPDGGQTDNTCKNGQTGCCGPDGDDLPCFDCYQDSH